MKKHKNLFIMSLIQATCMLVVALLDWLYSIYYQLEIAFLLERGASTVYILGYFLLFMIMVYCILTYNRFWKQLGASQGYLLTYTGINLIGQVILGRLKFLGFFSIALTEWILFTAFFFLFLGFNRLFLKSRGEH